MATNVLVVYYSTYGHTWRMAEAVVQGAEGVPGVGEVRLRRIPELTEARKALSEQDFYVQVQKQMEDIPEVTHDDLRWADGICWGTPTRFGNMTAQMKQFIDTLGGLWMQGELEDKPTGVFTSASTVQGGHETTLVSCFFPLLHLGMVIIGTPYGQNAQILTTDSIGSSPYGPGTIAGPDGSMQPTDPDLQAAYNLGKRVARFACSTKELCAEGPHGQQGYVPQYQG